MFAFGLGQLHTGWRLQRSETYSIEIPVDHSLVVHIDQSPRDVAELP